MFEVQIKVGRPAIPGVAGEAENGEGAGYPGGPGWLEEVTALVDTGALYSALPASLLEYLRVPVIEEGVEMTLGDGSVQEFNIGLARIVYGSHDMPCYVLFGAEDVCLLGATTLEAFRLTVDPVDQVLVPKVLRARPF